VKAALHGPTTIGSEQTGFLGFLTQTPLSFLTNPFLQTQPAMQGAKHTTPRGHGLIQSEYTSLGFVQAISI
jgi:hypothetical protein